MGIFDYFRLLKRMNALEQGLKEELEAYEGALTELETELKDLQLSLAGHIGGSKRWENIRNNTNVREEPKAIITPGNKDEIRDESVKDFIAQTGENPRDVALRLIREGKL